MIIQVNTDHHIDGNERLGAFLENKIADSLSRFSNQITRVEVHLADENGSKGGENDKRCTLEARLEGIEPLAVTEHADTVDKAVNGAINKLKSALDSVIGKLRAH